MLLPKPLIKRSTIPQKRNCHRNYRKNTHGQNWFANLCKISILEHHASDNFQKVRQRQALPYDLGPIRHAAKGKHKPRQQHGRQKEEEGQCHNIGTNQHCLEWKILLWGTEGTTTVHFRRAAVCINDPKNQNQHKCGERFFCFSLIFYLSSLIIEQTVHDVVWVDCDGGHRSHEVAVAKLALFNVTVMTQIMN